MTKEVQQEAKPTTEQSYYLPTFGKVVKASSEQEAIKKAKEAK